MNYGPTLEILEVEYSCSPGGVDTYEVYEIDHLPMDCPIFETE